MKVSQIMTKKVNYKQVRDMYGNRGRSEITKGTYIEKQVAGKRKKKRRYINAWLTRITTTHDELVLYVCTYIHISFLNNNNKVQNDFALQKTMTEQNRTMPSNGQVVASMYWYVRMYWQVRRKLETSSTRRHTYIYTVEREKTLKRPVTTELYQGFSVSCEMSF